MTQSLESCPWCGSLDTHQLLEVFDGHDALYATCCEAMHQWSAENNDWPPITLAGDVLPWKPRRWVDDQCGSLIIDYQPTIEPIPWKTAKTFVADHHAHCGPPVGWRYGAAAFNGPTMMAVITVGRPVARMIDASLWVEVNRLCVRRDMPSGMRWNICSQLYGWAARQARTRGYAGILTYTLEEEHGTSLRASGWQPVAYTRGGRWSCPSRRREDTGPQGRKVRWQRILDPSRLEPHRQLSLQIT